MAKYLVPVKWESFGMVEVYADSIDDAKHKAYHEYYSGPKEPSTEEYLDESPFWVNEDADIVEIEEDEQHAAL